MIDELGPIYDALQVVELRDDTHTFRPASKYL